MPKPNRQKFANLNHGAGNPDGLEDGALEGIEDGNEGDEGDDDDPAGEEEGNDGDDGGSGGEAKHTDAEVDAIIEKRLARERSKIERELRKQIEEENQAQLSEAEKLKNMTELQRAQYEAKKAKEEKELLQRKIDLSEQTAIARKELSNEGIELGDDLLSMFVSEDAEETSKAIEQIKQLWPEAVNAAVQKKLKRNAPPADKNIGQKSYGAEFAEKYCQSKQITKGGNE